MPVTPVREDEPMEIDTDEEQMEIDTTFDFDDLRAHRRAGVLTPIPQRETFLDLSAFDDQSPLRSTEFLTANIDYLVDSSLMLGNFFNAFTSGSIHGDR